MKVVIYTRVSTVEQAEKNKSLETQEKACRDYAAKANLGSVAEVYVEEGESAKTANRTQLKAMLAYCTEHRKEISDVIVWKLDRLARRTEDHIALANIFIKLGIRLHSATEVLEDTPSGKLMEHILASFAEFDNSLRSERSAKGMMARLQEGGWVHLAPIGYRNIKDTLGRPTVEPDEMAKNVQRFLKDFAKGLYNQDSAAELATTKYKIMSRSYTLVKGKRKYSKHYDKPVGKSTVYSMLRNPLYAGKITGKGIDEPIDGLHMHNALITTEEFDAIKLILTGSDKPVLRPYGKNKEHWPLRRYLKCAYCGSHLTGSRSRGRNNTYEYYHCTKCKGVKVRDDTYKHLALPREQVQKAYLNLMEGIQPSVGALRAFKEIVVRKWNMDYAETIARRQKAESDIAALDKKKHDYIEMCRVGTITDNELKDERDQIAIERTRLELELADIKQEFVSTDRVLDLAINFMANVASMWSVAQDDDRVRFQHMALPEGLTINANQKFGTVKVGLPFRQAKVLEAELVASKKTQNDSESVLVIPAGVEPAIFWMRTRCPGPLDDGTTSHCDDAFVSLLAKQACPALLTNSPSLLLSNS